MRLQGTTVNTAVDTRCTPQASALLQVLAERSHVARIERWLKGSARRAPAARGAQRAVRLCCVRAGRAVSASSTCHREAEARISMASTDRMVPKPTSHRSITGSRSCSHCNVAGGWSLLRNSGPLSRLCTAAPALADGRAECIFESVIPLEVAAAELVAPWLTRGAPSAILAHRHK